MVAREMGSIRQLSETELAELGDGDLLNYAIRQRDAGDADASDLALRIFAFGMEGRLRAFVRSRLDSHDDTVIEEVAERALEDAIRSIATLRGRTEAEARAFVFRIARLRIVDYLRKGRVQTSPMPNHGGDEFFTPEDGGLRVDGEADAIATGLLLEAALDDLRADHRAVVELFVMGGYSARETADLVRSRFEGQIDDTMSEQNVHQIGSRFRKDLRSRLEQAGEAVGG